MNDASGDQKDVYPIGKKSPTLPFYIRPFAPVTSSSSPGRSPRIPTEWFAAVDDACAFLQAVVAATSRNRPRTPIFPVAGMGCGKATSRANRLLPS